MRTPIPLLILLSVGGYAEINSSADLNCDFSTTCHWRNASGSEDSGEWIVSNRYEGDPLHLITTRRAGDGFFAYTNGFMGRTTALLVSEVVSCQIGGGNIKYWYFKTGIESQLEICTRQPPGSKDLNALNLQPDAAGPVGNDGAFGQAPPLLNSQAIGASQDLRRSPPVAASHFYNTDPVSPPSPHPEPKISNSGAEQSAGGSFASEEVTGSKLVGFSEGNDFCNYVTSVSEHDKVNGSLREWSMSSAAVLNSLTGVPHDLTKTGSFIYAGGTTVSPEDTFILSTKLPVELKEAARLDFFVYQAGIKGRLQVCLNTINNCALNIKGSTIDNRARKWKNYHVPVTTTTHAIHFVADELQQLRHRTGPHPVA
ncbi:hypothetical protein OSTOST_19582 [Ostertagia ostertagi]